MKQFDVLERSLNPLGPHFLEASAGTGKTFAIQHVVVRLLLLGSITIDQILVVTFTRAATRELKERIRSNLASLLKDLESKQTTVDYLQAIIDQGEDSIRTAKENIEAALACFDSAQIFTIHGFCHRMLTEFAFQAKVGFGLDDPESNQHRSSLRRFAMDFFRTQLKASSYGTSQIDAVLIKYRQNIEKLMNRMIAISQNKGEIQSYPDFNGSLVLFLEKLKKIQSVNAEFLIEDFERLKPCYKNMTKGAFAAQIDKLARILERKDCSLEEFDVLLRDKDFFLEKIDDKNLKAKVRFPELSSFHYPGLFNELAKEICPILKAARDPLKILLRMAKDFQNRSAKFLKKQEQLSHDQILYKAEECLEHGQFLEAVRFKYRAAIIDEFQDTDPVQWNIFKRIFLGHIDAVYLVGDPKQSIYRFRNADIYTYLDAAKQIGKENIAFLDTNFRSDPALVRALNSLFSAAGQWLDLPALNTSLQFLEVNSRVGAVNHEFQDGKGSVHFFLAQGHFEKKKNWLTEEIEPNFFFPFIAEEIINLNEREKFDLQNIAVLVRDRFQASKLQKFLINYNIPSHVKRAGSLADSEAMKFLKLLLEVASRPDDVNIFKKILASPVIGWQHHWIKNKSQGQNFQKAKSTFSDLIINFQKNGLASFFQGFLHSKWEVDEKTVLERLVCLDDLDFYQDLRQLVEILIECQTHSNTSPNDLLLFLKEIENTDPEEDERLKRRQTESKGSVPIMTIHVSKGLEFEIVFALGLSSRLKTEEEEIRVTENNQEKIIEFDSQNLLCVEALLEQDAEKMRQLYVALTRAKKRVYLPAAFDLEQEEIPLGKASAIELFLKKMNNGDNPTVYSVTAILDHLKNSNSITYQFLYTNKLEDREFGKEAPKIFCPLRLEEEKSRIKPAPSKTDSSGCLCIHPYEVKSSRKVEEHKHDWFFISPPKILDFPECIYSFSGLSKLHLSEEIEKETFSEISDIRNFHSIPSSKETGQILHRIFEKIFISGIYTERDSKIGASAAPEPIFESRSAYASFEGLTDLVHHEIEKTHLIGWEQEIIKLIKETFSISLIFNEETFCLKDVNPEELFPEMEFIFSLKHSFLKGFIDLVFKYKDKYYILDWKSNRLGNQDDSYTQSKIEMEMQQREYYLQAAIYTLALKRYVKLFDIRAFEECFGGVIYVFLRGQKAYHFFPDLSLICLPV